MATAPIKQTTTTTTSSTSHLSSNVASKVNEPYKQKASLSAVMEQAIQTKKEQTERDYRRSEEYDDSEIDLSFGSTTTPPEIVLAVLRNHNIDFGEHNRIMHPVHANYFTLVDDRETDLEKRYRSFPISLKSIESHVTAESESETSLKTPEEAEMTSETVSVEIGTQIPITTVSHETEPVESVAPIASIVSQPVVSSETTVTNTLGTLTMASAPTVAVVNPIPEIPSGESILTYEIPVTVSQPVVQAATIEPVVKPFEQPVVTPVPPVLLPENPTPESILMYEIPVTIHPDVIQNAPAPVSHETNVVTNPVSTPAEPVSFMVSPFGVTESTLGNQPEQKVVIPESTVTKAVSDIETARTAYGREWEAYQKNLYDTGSQGTRQQLFGSAGKQGPNLFPSTDAYHQARETYVAELKAQGKTVSDIINWIHQETDRTIGLLGEKKRQVYIKLANKFGLISIVPVNNFNLNIADTTTNRHELISNKLGLGIAALDKPYVTAAHKLFEIVFPGVVSQQLTPEVAPVSQEQPIPIPIQIVSEKINRREVYDKLSHAVLQALLPQVKVVVPEPKPLEMKPLSFSGKPKSEPEELFA